MHSAPAASRRSLDGVPGGVETVLVGHTGNTTSSDEVADAVIRQARRHLCLAWTPPLMAIPDHYDKKTCWSSRRTTAR